MRLAIPLLLSSLALAACGKADPTKPVPWLTKPPDPKSSVPADVVAADPEQVLIKEAAIAEAMQRPGRSACNIPRENAPVLLSDLLAAPHVYGGQKIQVAGRVGSEVSFIKPAVYGVPVCTHAFYYLAETPSDIVFDAPEERLDLHDLDAVNTPDWCPSANVPGSEVVVAWGTVSIDGDELIIDGICAADELECDDAAECPAAMACDGVCEIP